MSQKWNLQDIRPAGGTKRTRKRPQAEPREVEQTPDTVHTETESPRRNATIPIHDGNRTKRNRFLLIAIVFIVVLGGGFVLSALRSGADVTVNPRFKEVNVQATFTAYSEPQIDNLTYELMVLETEGERQVEAAGQRQVEELAEGEIIIYKNTPGAQPLITNTRFESPDGLIFKLKESVIVPGAVENEAGELVPGSISVEVFSEAVGQEYNLDPTKFTIPGLKDDPVLFDAIYGESNEVFTGGFNGKKFDIDEGELQTARQALHTELRDILLAEMQEKRPAGFVLFNAAPTFTFESLPEVTYGDNIATIKEKAYLRVPLFKEEDFAMFIAEATVQGYENLPVRIDDYSTLSFAYTSATTSASDISFAPSIEFNLTGKPLIVWTYDVGKFKLDITGISRTAFHNRDGVLSTYPAIENASAKIKPFWKQSLPDSIDEIEVFEVIDR